GAGFDREYADAIFVYFFGEDFSEPYEGSLTRDVSRHVWNSHQAGTAGYIDDPAPSEVHHARQDGTSVKIRSQQIDLEASPPVAGVGFREGAKGRGHSRIVDEQIDRSQLLFDPVYDSDRRLVVGNIRGERYGLPAACNDF